MTGRGGQQYPLRAPGVDPAWYIPWVPVDPGPKWNVPKPRTYKIPYWVDETKTVLPLWMFDSEGGLLDNLEWDDWGQGYIADVYEVSWTDGPGSGGGGEAAAAAAAAAAAVEEEVVVNGAVLIEAVVVEEEEVIEEAAVEVVEGSIEVEVATEVAAVAVIEAAVEIEAELNTELEVIGVVEGAEIEVAEEVVTEVEAATEVVAEEETEAAEAAEAAVLSKTILGQLVKLSCNFARGIPTTA